MITTIAPTRSPRLRKAIAALGMCLAAASSMAMTTGGLRPSTDIDLSRAGRLGADERSLLRLEWKAELSRSDEATLLHEMLGRIEHIEATTRDLHTLVVAMPAHNGLLSGASANQGGEKTLAAATADPTDATDSLPPGWPLLAAGAAVLLLLGYAWKKRQGSAPRAATAASQKAATPPRIEPTPVPRPETPTAPPQAALTPNTPPPQAAEPTSAVAASTELPAAEHREALELAEIMLSMGLTSGAAQTLQEHIRNHPKQALFHWLKLLEVYRRSGNKFQFESASRELQQHFNIQPENWAKMHSSETATLESFDRVLKHVQDIWQAPGQAINYLQHLLEDNRGGTRAGFPQTVAEEILLLIDILKGKAALA